MSPKAVDFAEHYAMYCLADKKCIKVKYDPGTRSWMPAIELLLTNMSEDAFQHQFITGDTIDVVRARIESILCRAAEAGNDQPRIFPMSA
jgi:hypothetical protein